MQILCLIYAFVHGSPHIVIRGAVIAQRGLEKLVSRISAREQIGKRWTREVQPGIFCRPALKGWEIIRQILSYVRGKFSGLIMSKSKGSDSRPDLR
jgi:hypothetical protein